MPVTLQAVTFYAQDIRRSWQHVNHDFEALREAVERMDEHELSERERALVLREYRRVRGWLYGLLPECEEREE